MDRELMEGMCNCYSACGEDYDGTVRMVAGARGRTSAEVKETLARLAKDNANDIGFRELRNRLPSNFPF